MKAVVEQTGWIGNVKAVVQQIGWAGMKLIRVTGSKLIYFTTQAHTGISVSHT